MNGSYAMIDVCCLDIMRQSSSSMVSSSPFTYLTYMLIDLLDELVGSYTYCYVNVSFHPPRVTSYTKLSSTLFLSISIIISIWSDQPRSSWSLLLHAKLVYCDNVNYYNNDDYSDDDYWSCLWYLLWWIILSPCISITSQE